MKPTTQGRPDRDLRRTHTRQLYWLPRDVLLLPHWNWPSMYALTASVAPMRTVYLLPDQAINAPVRRSSSRTVNGSVESTAYHENILEVPLLMPVRAVYAPPAAVA